MTVEDAAAGQLLCAFDPEDTVHPGTYNVQVRLVAKSKLTGATVIDEPLEILDAAAGLCQFSREIGDYLQGDRCKAEIVVTFGNGAVLILPTTGYYSLTIEDSLI